MSKQDQDSPIVPALDGDSIFQAEPPDRLRVRTSGEEAIYIYHLLISHGIPAWISGGWGIDALLGEQTRPHKDLDVLMLLDDVNRLRQIMSHAGYVLKEFWSENTHAKDGHGLSTATAFVLQDAGGHELDVHALYLDAQGNGIPAWNNPEGLTFTLRDLDGEGEINGIKVRCLSPESQLKCHTGYTLPDYQVLDLKRLHERYGIENLN